MLSKLLAAWGLMALSVALHAAGMSFAVRWLRRRPGRSQRFLPLMWLFVSVAGWVVLLHLSEIAVWALFYVWTDAMPDPTSALYFSSVTYTTTGYGDLVLPEKWRLVGGIEALTGILMCGWSTGFFFAVVSRLHDTDSLGR